MKFVGFILSHCSVRWVQVRSLSCRLSSFCKKVLSVVLFLLAYSQVWAQAVICLYFRSLARAQSLRCSIRGFLFTSKEPPCVKVTTVWEYKRIGMWLLQQDKLETHWWRLIRLTTQAVKELFYFVLTGQIFVCPLWGYTYRHGLRRQCEFVFLLFIFPLLLPVSPPYSIALPA